MTLVASKLVYVCLSMTTAARPCSEARPSAQAVCVLQWSTIQWTATRLARITCTLSSTGYMACVPCMRDAMPHADVMLRIMRRQRRRRRGACAAVRGEERRVLRFPPRCRDTW